MGTLQAVRGMHDLFGDSLEKWGYVEKVALEVLQAYGYREVRTPVLEKKEVFSQSVGEDTDIVEKQMYEIPANPLAGDEDTYVLRPEGTAAFMRACVEHGLYRETGPGRYFYAAPMFRRERPQKGRLRQFHQIGAELIQENSPESDAESILLLDTIFGKLGLRDYQIRLNSVGTPECRSRYKEVLKAYFSAHLSQLCGLCQKRFERSPLRILDCKNEVCRPFVEKAPSILESLSPESKSHHTQVKRSLSLCGVGFIEDDRIVRGLDYYSRTVFEFTTQHLGAQSALGAGGRYDDLASRFGVPAFPGVGWAFGVERVLLALEALGKEFPKGKGFDVYLIPLEGQAFDFLFALGYALKGRGLSVEMSYARDKKLKWYLKQADRSEARYSILVGENEWTQKQALLKDMSTGDQRSLSFETLEKELVKTLSS